MIQLTLLNGQTAGAPVIARRLPFNLGRDKRADLCLEQPGIWERHLELQFAAPEGVVLHSHPSALTLVNGQAVQRTRLRTGDIIEVGSLRLRFDLGPTRQRDLRLREALTWLGLIALAGVQFCLIYLLLP
jgi:hypothetical protein